MSKSQPEPQTAFAVRKLTAVQANLQQFRQVISQASMVGALGFSGRVATYRDAPPMNLEMSL